MGKSITKVLKATSLTVLGTLAFFSLDKFIDFKAMVPELQLIVYSVVVFGIIVFVNQLHKILNQD
jgi:hypothetical protein